MPKYAFFPGCVSRGGCPELYPAARRVCDRLGIELEELVGASCCGAGVLQEKGQLLGDVLNARTFAMAEFMGLPILTICSTCQGVMSQANKRLKDDPEYLAKVNSHLAEEYLEYQGTAVIKHLLWVVIEDVGLDTLKRHVTRPLTHLRVAPFYGCYILRPSDALGFDENPERQTSLETVIETLGGEVVDFSGKSRCCGFPLLTINEPNSVAMVAKHTIEASDLGADAMVTPCPLVPPEPGRLPAQGHGASAAQDKPAYPPLAPAYRHGHGYRPQGPGLATPHHHAPESGQEASRLGLDGHCDGSRGGCHHLLVSLTSLVATHSNPRLPGDTIYSVITPGPGRRPCA